MKKPTSCNLKTVNDIPVLTESQSSDTTNLITCVKVPAWTARCYTVHKIVRNYRNLIKLNGHHTLQCCTVIQQLANHNTRYTNVRGSSS